ncbi:MAG: hypothetical protein ABJZ55_02040 [Fuerstiella sp.]
MAALAKIQPISQQGPVRDIASRPVLAAVKIFKGALLGITAAGFARPFATGDKMGGHAMDTVDNTDGGNGAVSVDASRGIYTLTVPVFDGVVLGDTGDDVTAVSDNHADLIKAVNTTDVVGKVSAVTVNGVQVTFKTFEVA